MYYITCPIIIINNTFRRTKVVSYSSCIILKIKLPYPIVNRSIAIIIIIIIIMIIIIVIINT